MLSINTPLLKVKPLSSPFPLMLLFLWGKKEFLGENVGKQK
ncbi:hypothetical protein HMPREF6123_0222 [Oribacterium sinus F0268]|uniref:Uncharacterized protein n=1 Tax=Oribacterium sinus F0268 TaxID=585501 RepID=C2KUQ3_9FIRM|nr:hypothetical protein HMPREF6123_0222 [Oribacterium sinus F0268]